MSDADTAAGGEESFLTRWSRRKHEDRATTVDQAPEVVEEQEALAEEQPEALPTDEDMPPIETLDEQSDYTGFMSPEVSEELRKLALRKLFSSQVFNVRDGLDDYDDDFTSFAKLGDIVTSDMRYQMERMKEAMQDDEDSDQAAETQIDEETGLSAEEESIHEAGPESDSDVVEDTLGADADIYKEETDGQRND